ncbi:MAG: antitoxin Xre/MbcA/ParS toxin-binding domain-containing protein [Chitinophagaceae bacterium]
MNTKDPKLPFERNPYPTFEVQEPPTPYYRAPQKILPGVLTKVFRYKHFKQIADKAPFSLLEWANLLYMSERTLQRYAKDNSEFNGMQIERILLMERLIDLGNDFFGKENFKSWLHTPVLFFNQKPPIHFLVTYDGTLDVINLIGRMQHGIPS